MEPYSKILPILLEEDRIMEAISDNICVIICGETGCGKTTKVPQFLFHAGFGSDRKEIYKKGMIGITEPRRIATILMASAISKELKNDEIVGYQIRFENTTTEKTKIKLMTDGILLKEIEQDFMLSKYSVIILDEAHERSLHTDILIGLLSRIVLLRHKRGLPLKWIIMSATLCLSDFTQNDKLFPIKPPLINIESRQFPVSIHFSKNTDDNYIESASKKVAKIHKTLPLGHILVFVSCQQEVVDLTHILKERFQKRNKKSKMLSPDFKISKNFSHTSNSVNISVNVLPLYAMLPKEKQIKVFKEYASNCRKIIVSTNVAETSITIPGVKYIVDTGKEKKKIFDKISGAQRYIITWCSKASANQRTGRAGRTSAGHCYRLYSSAVFQYDFPDFSEPEIFKQSIQGVVLQMKCMNLGNIKNFPFPTPPLSDDIERAEETLCILGALEPTKSKTGIINLPTNLGRKINLISLIPRYSKMVFESLSRNVASYIITITSALSTRDLMTENIDTSFDQMGNTTRNNFKIQNKLWAGKGIHRKLGDFMVLINCIGASLNSTDITAFCCKYGIRKNALDEIYNLYNLTKTQASKICEVEIPNIYQIRPPSDKQVDTIRKILTVCLKDQIARKIDRSMTPCSKGCATYEIQSINQPVVIHSHSIYFNKDPEIVVYNELRKKGKNFEIMGICEIDEEWVVK